MPFPCPPQYDLRRAFVATARVGMPTDVRRLARTDRRPRTIEEAAAYLGLTVRTMRTLRHHPDLHPAKIAGRLMYDPEYLDAFFESCKEVG